MGNDNNPSIKTDLFSEQQSPDTSSSPASETKSSPLRGCSAPFVLAAVAAGWVASRNGWDGHVKREWTNTCANALSKKSGEYPSQRRRHHRRAVPLRMP